MAGETLVLEATDFKDPQHWRWMLKDSKGKFLEDFEVGLDSRNSNYSAFLDLYSFLEANSSPDRWIDDQTKLIHQVGAWIGKEALGRVGERIAKFSTTVTIKVLVPPEASGLLYRPWEIAMVGDKPLAMRNVSLVFEMKGEKPFVSPVPIQDRLRMLAVFSLPTDASALSLRRERYELMKLINQLAQASGYAIEMRVLQYGTTRESLQEALEEGEGWDLIHFSGHGDKATLILEKPDGSHDPVTSQELSALLSLASGRLKLVTLSACLSAAATIQETLAWLKIEQPERSRNAQACASARETPMPALALELMTKMDCTALAMRYPVGDEFAINLATELYRLMLEKGNTLTRSLQLAMQKALKDGYNAATPPLSLATPALFGSKAADIIIKPPQAQAGEFRMPTIGLAYFPAEPKRFVGRTGPLGRASSALAKDSDKRGVLFHGMAGAGKTACALELAYHQRRSPRFLHFVWHEAPKEGSDIEGALSRLALDMEKQLPGFKMAHLVDRAEDFRAWLPVLSETLEQNSVLIVLDNLENLLTSDGGWKDDRWGWLVQSLLDHEGLSRIVLTSRKLPKELIENGRLLIEPINALSLNEAALLAREMPHLGRLLLGKSSLGIEKGRQLVKRTLSLVQGHPKLIELADAQAADPASLEKYLERAVGAWSDSESHLDRFFKDGESARTAEEFLKVLTRWTKDVSGSLPESSRTLFRFMCALEDDDRQDWIVKQVWPDLWKALGYSSDAPSMHQALSTIKSDGLAESQALGKQVKYAIHPSMAQAGLEEVDEKFRLAVDSMMGSLWRAVFDQARSGEDQEAGLWIITAGLRSAPYLIRQKKWSEASTLLEQAIYRDSSPETIASVLPLLRHIAQAAKGTDSELKDSSLLANALFWAGRWQEAEDMLRSLILKFVAKRDFSLASVEAGYLFNILQQTGRYEEALALVDEMKDYTIKAGVGPWTQLMNKALRLQALNSLGRYDEVLEAVEKLKVQMKSLPYESDLDELVIPWNIREGILDAGGSAAMGLEKHELALEFNAEIIDVTKSRGATDLELAKTMFNDYGPLLRLKRYDEAGRLLWACKEVFEKERSIETLGMIFSALADLKYNLGQADQAISFEETSLRYSYLFGHPESISISHNNLALYLRESGSQSALDHRLAAEIIRYRIGSGMLASSLVGMARDLDRFGPEAVAGSFDELCARMEQVDGVRFKELCERLPKQAEDGDRLLKEIVKAARNARP
jgi:tetratricopeptide (TPR) repeat protein